ncbi:hypothetical protein [Polluticoccus soli]|uniref:hypothetical protein n=1 Tax=Polluticoccus soli TaxID=3034150 RepID=UPI0023E0C82B|nr:hypothetical protein [Flavipsychrobacter sp. JY13-12]
MIQKIESIDDVKTFFRQLKTEDLNFHPDTPFEDYINGETKQDTYTKEEAITRNRLLDRSFDICERDNVDIYELGIEVFEPFTSE